MFFFNIKIVESPAALDDLNCQVSVGKLCQMFNPIESFNDS